MPIGMKIEKRIHTKKVTTPLLTCLPPAQSLFSLFVKQWLCDAKMWPNQNVAQQSRQKRPTQILRTNEVLIAGSAVPGTWWSLRLAQPKAWGFDLKLSAVQVASDKFRAPVSGRDFSISKFCCLRLGSKALRPVSRSPEVCPLEVLRVPQGVAGKSDRWSSP
jgi:hypothetical protein